MKADSKSFFAELRVGGLYDSRVGSASGGGDEDGDSAIAATLSAGWQAPLDGNFGFRTDYGGYMDFHQDFDQYDVIDQSISIEPQYNLDKLTYSLPLAYNYALEDGETDYSKYTVSPTITWLIPETNQALAFYGIGSIIDDRDDDNVLDEDGDAVGAGCAYVIFGENASRIRLSLDYQHSRYDAQVVDYGTVFRVHR